MIPVRIHTMLLVLAVWATIGCGQPSVSPVSTEPSSRQEYPLGQKLYEAHCATCHGVTGRGSPGIFQGKVVRFDDPAFQRLLSDAAIRHTVQHGRGLMPPFEGTFQEAELTALIQYVRSLAASTP